MPAASPARQEVRVRRLFVDGRYGQLHQPPLSGRMFSELPPQLGRDRVVNAPDTPGYGEPEPRLRSLRVPVTIIRPKDGLWEEGAAAAPLIPGARRIREVLD